MFIARPAARPQFECGLTRPLKGRVKKERHPSQ
jgi:hypothetical protein